MPDAVVFERVSFSYPGPDEEVLKDVSFELEEGSFVLVTGPTGSGKSTLIRAMNGLVPHFSGGRFRGRVLVGGRDTATFRPRDLADVAAFVPQDPDASFVVERVEDELAYAMENVGASPAVMRRRVEETLDLLAIAHLRDWPVHSLSGGERQRVAIAAALTPGPRVLLLDEPTSQLDPQAAEDVLAALQRLVHDLGITVVLAEHRLERVAGFADAAVACPGDGTAWATDTASALDAVGGGPPVSKLGRLLGWAPVPVTVRDARRRRTAIAPEPSRSRPVARRDPLLTVRGVGASYGDAMVLRDVSLDVGRGEIVAFIGRNGAGKTTLLRCVAGLHEPGEGKVEVDGERVRAGDVALSPQRPEDLLFASTVAGELRITFEARRVPDGSTRMLEELGLSTLGSRHPRDLSAGERLLVAIGAVIAAGSPLLLLDEPTRGLDAEAKARLVSMLQGHACRANAVVLATHDVELVAELATRVVMLAGGAVVADGPPGEVLGDSPVFSPQMARVFGPGWLTVEQVARAMSSRARTAPA